MNYTDSISYEQYILVLNYYLDRLSILTIIVLIPLGNRQVNRTCVHFISILCYGEFQNTYEYIKLTIR